MVSSERLETFAPAVNHPRLVRVADFQETWHDTAYLTDPWDDLHIYPHENP